MKKIALASIGLMVLVAALLALVLHFRDQARPPAPAAAAPTAPIKGRLVIRSLSDMQVASRPIVLCGVANQRPAALQPMLLEAARKAWNGREVTCIPVGQGTPCDGRTAPTFAGAVVVQCMTDAGTDVAADLAGTGILCGVTQQSAGTYRSCGAAR